MIHRLPIGGAQSRSRIAAVSEPCRIGAGECGPTSLLSGKSRCRSQCFVGVLLLLPDACYRMGVAPLFCGESEGASTDGLGNAKRLLGWADRCRRAMPEIHAGARCRICASIAPNGHGHRLKPIFEYGRQYPAQVIVAPHVHAIARGTEDKKRAQRGRFGVACCPVTRRRSRGIAPGRRARR